MKFIQLSLFIFLASITYSTKGKLFQLNKKIKEPQSLEKGILSSLRIGQSKDNVDVESAKTKAEFIKNVRDQESHLKAKDPSFGNDIEFKNDHYLMDPILNGMRRTEIKESSSLEMPFWKDEWNEAWLQKKFEAIQSKSKTGDTVNMAAARPWGVPCGDTNQHDMPWGTCMMKEECDAEYRIYRGDIFCGRSSFICCALVSTTYDMYQGIDQSFDGTSFETDEEERKRENKAKSNRGKISSKRKRNLERKRRKRKIKKTIRNIIKEIRRIVNRISRNHTKTRNRKTKWLRKYITHLKKQYKKDRYSIREVHDVEMNKTHNAEIKKLEDMKKMNLDFYHNSTFRDIVVNGSVNPEVLRLLSESYPELKVFLDVRRSSRRQMDTDALEDYLEYDIEYGNVYF